MLIVGFFQARVYRQRLHRRPKIIAVEVRHAAGRHPQLIARSVLVPSDRAGSAQASRVPLWRLSSSNPETVGSIDTQQ
jgi:hypothetical protein